MSTVAILGMCVLCRFVCYPRVCLRVSECVSISLGTRNNLPTALCGLNLNSEQKNEPKTQSKFSMLTVIFSNKSCLVFTYGREMFNNERDFLYFPCVSFVVVVDVLTELNRVLVLLPRDSCVLYQLNLAFEKPLRVNVYFSICFICVCVCGVYIDVYSVAATIDTSGYRKYKYKYNYEDSVRSATVAADVAVAVVVESTSTS